MNESINPAMVQIVFFSGTGGTERIANCFEQALNSRKIQTALLNLDFSSPDYRDPDAANNTSAELMILLFAVHAFDAPLPVYTWLEQLPASKKRAVVLSVSGGGEAWPNTGCRSACCKALEEKGLKVVYDGMMCMPSNWVTPVNDHLAMHLIQAVPGKVEQILSDVLSGRIVRTYQKKSPLRAYITKIEKKDAKRFPEAITIDESCKGCGWCANHCPTGNIEIENGKPVFKSSCVMCFRCIYDCPTHAMHSTNFMVLKGGYNLNAVEKRMQGVPLQPIQECCRGLAWSAVRKYLLMGSQD